MAEKKTEKKDNKILSKKNIKIAVIVIAIIAFVGIVFALDNKDLSIKKEPGVTKVGKEKVRITQNETSKIEYDTFDNGLVSFKYPKGWKVEIAPTDYTHYTFKMYNPDNPTYMLLFGMKQEGALKSERARQVFANYYPDSPFAKIAPIDPQTTEAFFKVWNHNSDYNNSSGNTDFFMHLDNFTVIDNLGTDMVGGDILRATYNDSNGDLAQGIFTAAVKSVGVYKVSENIFNPFGPQVDVSPLNIYNIMIMSAPDADFVNWQSILDNCLATVQFSEEFVSGFNKEQDTLMKTIQANAKVYDEISDMIMDSWEKRSNSYDIISQKQSDATLGYERVYDTQTGDIYKADSGFMDNDWNGRYESVTDDMYNQPISGYIEKVD